MNIKSLLLGSAAALAVVSGAQAADAIVAAEPEPAEYVKVCDAFGSGYFYIPGTETCLKVGGRIRLQQAIGDGADYAPVTKGRISVSGKQDSEMGAIEGYVEMEGVYDATATPASKGSVSIGDVYIAVGGLKAGRYGGLWDNGIGENVSEGAVPGDFKVQYTGSADAATFGVQIDELSVNADGKGANNIGAVAQIGATLGGLSVNGYMAYDNDASAANLKIISSAKVGPGTLTFGGAWFGGDSTLTNGVVKTVNAYGEGNRNWVLAAAYEIAAGDKVTIAPEFEYFDLDVAGKDSAGKAIIVSDSGWTVGALATYTMAPGLNAKLNVTYNNSDVVGGWLRFERSF